MQGVLPACYKEAQEVGDEGKKRKKGMMERG